MMTRGAFKGRAGVFLSRLSEIPGMMIKQCERGTFFEAAQWMIKKTCRKYSDR
jgi:hypothetical protein